LEARDAFDRGTRSRRPTREVPAATEVPTAETVAASAAPPSAPATASPEASLPARPFSSTRTILAGESKGAKPVGFDTSDVKVRKAPELLGRLEFEVDPVVARPGDLVKVRVIFSNEGRKAVRLRSVLLTLSGGAPRSVPPVTRDIKPQRRETVAEWAGTMPQDFEAWSLEVLMGADTNETALGRLEWQ
jgi:hypothetical protein